ncbi:MAG: hypothetical protein E7478_07440 [Ruminococcaceae bacterium]|nr:hypothetical protein [Oscillospiraceae bacterium]
MPKRKPSAITAAAEIVHRNIESRACTLFGVNTVKDISARIGIPRETFRQKKLNPRAWTLEQLCMAAQSLKVPLSWLMTDHSGEIKEVTSDD